MSAINYLLSRPTICAYQIVSFRISFGYCSQTEHVQYADLTLHRDTKDQLNCDRNGCNRDAKVQYPVVHINFMIRRSRPPDA
mgnify:CR=1 FL=1